MGVGAAGLTLLRYAPTGTITKYCTAKPSSIPGCVPHLDLAGAPSASAGKGFHLSVAPLPANNPGIFFYTTHGSAAVPVHSLMGWLCIAPTGICRIVPTQSSPGTSSPCDGHFLLDFNRYFAERLEPDRRRQVHDPVVTTAKRGAARDIPL